MKTSLVAFVMAALLLILPGASYSGLSSEKKHDFIPQFHNVIFLLDVSDSMTAGYPINYDHAKFFVSGRAFELFNLMMPHVPRWQYDVNTAIVTFGDAKYPRVISPLSPWYVTKYPKMLGCLRSEEFCPFRTALLQDALQVAGSLITTAAGRTAIVIFSDGGSDGECAQKTAAALKDEFGNKVVIYAVSFATCEVGWRNLYEVCKLTGGYCRAWEDVRTKKQMKEFAWDITVREVMFPYPEIFFPQKSAQLVPSEALKLEGVANFLRAIPQYELQIDGHTTFVGDSADNYQLGMKRAASVKDALVKMYCIAPQRIHIRSWGEELPRYDNENIDVRQRNREANLYLRLPLRNYPYDEKNLHTFGEPAVGTIYNTQERNVDEEWAWPDKPASGSGKPPVSSFR